MTIYAKTTNVSTDRSKSEIERNLMRYGASHFAYGTDIKSAKIGFVYKGRNIRITLPLPRPDDFQNTPSGRKRRNKEDMLFAWEQACRSKWRALNLIIIAKLEAIESGIASFENEFLAYTALPSGQTLGEVLTPKIDRIIESGKMPNLLLPEPVEAEKCHQNKISY